MTNSSRQRLRRLLTTMTLGGLAVTVTGCSAGSLGSSDDGGGGTSLSFLVDSDPGNLAAAEALAEAYTADNPDVTIDVESRPGGSEGDNIVKTRLATGDMADLFLYNSGSLFQAIGPAQTLAPVTDETWVGDLEENFRQAVTAGEDVYGAPLGALMTGAVLYNTRVYEELGLQVPTTWEEFMANNARIEEAGLDPVIQTYADTWTSQLFVLGDFHNVSAVEPDFAERYTADEAKFASSPAALRGFEHLQEVQDAGYVNEDYASATYEQGLRSLAAGEGVHYPQLTFTLSALATAAPDQAEDVGIFPLPGDDAATNGLTLWSPPGVYVPQSTEGEQLEAARAFLGFIASPEGCAVQAEAAPPTGPYAVEGCELPADVLPAVEDFQSYVDAGTGSPALEFLSPIKGPALEQITVEVGSGIRPAADGAALYDEDVRKQAQQLGLEGWE